MNRWLTTGIRSQHLASLMMANRTTLCLGLFLLGATLPAAAQEQLSNDSALCRSMGQTPVFVISLGILITITITLVVLYRQLRNGGWSLANAISEPTHLSIPLDEHWAQSQGDNQARIDRKSTRLNSSHSSVSRMPSSA